MYYTTPQTKRQVYFKLQNKFDFLLDLGHNSRCLGMIRID